MNGADALPPAPDAPPGPTAPPPPPPDGADDEAREKACFAKLDAADARLKTALEENVLVDARLAELTARCAALNAILDKQAREDAEYAAEFDAKSKEGAPQTEVGEEDEPRAAEPPTAAPSPTPKPSPKPSPARRPSSTPSRPRRAPQTPSSKPRFS